MFFLLPPDFHPSCIALFFPTVLQSLLLSQRTSSVISCCHFPCLLHQSRSSLEQCSSLSFPCVPVSFISASDLHIPISASWSSLALHVCVFWPCIVASWALWSIPEFRNFLASDEGENETAVLVVASEPWLCVTGGKQ